MIGTSSTGKIFDQLKLEPDVLIAEPNYIQRSFEARKNSAWAIGNPDTDDGAQIVDMRLGTLSRTRLFASIAQLASCSAADPDVAYTDISDAGDDADATRCSKFAGVVIVAASGNDASDATREYPAAEGASSLLAVAASGSDQRLAKFSDFGSWVQIAAPGDLVTSTFPGGG